MKANVLSAVAVFLTLLTGIGEAADKAAVPDLVTRVCSTCHGVRGLSVSPTFPNLAGQQTVYLETQLKAFRDHSRADPHAQAFMWGMAAQLTDSAITEIAAYYTSQPPAPGNPAGSAEVAAGKKIFEEGIEAQQVPACQACHGAEAKGNGPFPRLAGQHRDYLEKQLEAFAVNLRANEIMHQNSKGLTALQISQLSAYLSSR